jgi:hypothetical protein
VKASISRRIACIRLIKQEKINKKLTEDSWKLSRDFKLSQAANLDLEKKVAIYISHLFPHQCKVY